MAGPLYDRCSLLELLLAYVEIQLVEVTFYDIDLTGLEDIPSLIVPVIRVIDDKLFTLLVGRFRNVDKFLGVLRNDKAISIQDNIVIYWPQKPNIWTKRCFNFLQNYISLMQAKILII